MLRARCSRPLLGISKGIPTSRLPRVYGSMWPAVRWFSDDLFTKDFTDGPYALFKQMKQAKADGDMSSFFTDLKTLMQFAEPERAFSDEIVELLAAVPDPIPAANICDWVRAVRRIHLESGEPSRSSLFGSVVRRLHNAQGVSVEDRSRCLYNLVRAQCTLADLDQKDHTPFFNIVHCLLEDLLAERSLDAFKPLAQLGISWRTLPTSTTKHLWAKVENIAAGDAPAGAYLVAVLGRLRLQLSELNESERAVIEKIVVQSLNQEALASEEVVASKEIEGFADIAQGVSVSSTNSSSNLVTVIRGLHGMGFHTNSQATVISLLDSALLVKIRSLNTHDLAMLIFTFGKMNFPCSSAVSAALVDAVAANAAIMMNYQLSFALQGLSQLGMMWRDLPQEFKAHVLSAKWHCEDGSEKIVRRVAITLGSMGWMGARWNNLPVEFHENILKVLLQLEQSGSSNDLAWTLTGLSSLGVQFRGVPSKVCEAIASAFQRINSSGPVPARNVADIVAALVDMRATWASMLFSLQIMVDRMRDPNVKDVSNVLFGLAQLGMRLSTSQKTRLAGYISTLQSWTTRDVSLAIYGLGGIGVGWRKFEQPVQKAILKLLASPSTFADCKPKAFGMTLAGLYGIGVKWSDLPGPALEMVLVRTLSDMSLGEFASNVEFMGKLSARWTDLQPSTRIALAQAYESLLPKMSDLDVSTCMGAIALMSFDVEDPQDEMLWRTLRAVAYECRGVIAQALRGHLNSTTSIRFIRTLQTLPGGKEFVAIELGERELRRKPMVGRSLNHCSAAVSESFSSTLEPGFQVFAAQDLSDIGYLVDFTVCRDGVPIAFLDCSWSEGNRHWALKQHLLSVAHPKALIEFHHVEKGKEFIVGKKLAQKVLQHWNQLNEASGK